MIKQSFKKSSYADIHLHLGGAIQPRILWHQVNEVEQTDELTKKGFRTYGDFENFFKKERRSLEEYLEMFDIVEPIQKIERLDYFIKRIMRGAFEFENLSYIELRYCPYSRTVGSSEKEKIEQMETVVRVIQRAIETYGTRSGGNEEFYPIKIKQILCLHSQKKYTPNVNAAILDLAIKMKEEGIVCGIDIAGGEGPYEERFEEILNSFKRAKDPANGLKTTAHIFETKRTPRKAIKLFEYLDRIGHGILIPLEHHYYLKELKERGICLEFCPTTYFKCGMFDDYNQLSPAFNTCEKYGVDLVVCTDNSGMHMTRLQQELESLLIHHVISHTQMNEIRKNAFKHSFGLSEEEKNIFLQDRSLRLNLGDIDLELEF